MAANLYKTLVVVLVIGATAALGWLMSPWYEGMVRYLMYGKPVCSGPIVRNCLHVGKP